MVVGGVCGTELLGHLLRWCESGSELLRCGLWWQGVLMALSC